MSYVPVLPKLRGNAALNPPSTANWEWRNEDFIKDLIGSLDVGENMADFTSVDSIPDIWGRPILFEMILMDGHQDENCRQFTQTVYRQALAEWRCLLAMLALADYRNLPIRVECVELSNEENTFLTVLKKMLPTKGLYQNANWNPVHLLFYDQMLLGILSPTTLVCPAPAYDQEKVCFLRAPWGNGNRLKDPSSCLREEERTALYFWLNELESCDRRQDLYDVMQKNIQDYKMEIKKLGISTGQHNIKSLNFPISNDSFYSLLNYCTEAPPPDPAQSDFLLKGVHTGKQLLLLDPEILRKAPQCFGKRLEQLVVWQGFSAADLLDDRTFCEGNGTRSAIPFQNVEMLRLDDLFCKKIAFSEKERTVDHHPVPDLFFQSINLKKHPQYDFLLPLTDKFMKCFSIEEIKQYIRIRYDEKSILFEFTFRFEQGNFIYKRKYDILSNGENSTQNNQWGITSITREVPVLEAWPNFCRSGWEKYYIFCANYNAQNQGRSSENRPIFLPWTEDGSLLREKSDRYTRKVCKFPEAFFCYINSNSNSNLNLNEDVNDESLGALLPKKLPIIHITEDVWEIGVDFGTSSTMVFARQNNRNPIPLPFVCQLNQLVRGQKRQFNLEQFFIPSISQETGSFMSVFHLLDHDAMNRVSKGEGTLRALIDGHIYFLNQGNESLSELGEALDVDLKWKWDDSKMNYKSRAYLEQVCLHALVEVASKGAKEVKWRFSYPTSFSKNEKNMFKNQTHQIVDEVMKNSGLLYDNTQICLESESVAAARYFESLGTEFTNFNNGAVCLDIGAGTTDISIISSNEATGSCGIVYHTSIRLAGNQIFKYIGEWFGDLQKDKPRPSAIDDNTWFAMLLRKNGDEIFKNISTQSGEKDTVQAIQPALVIVAGIFYYIGLILKALHDKKLYRETCLPRFFVGGNGSRVFHWITMGNMMREFPLCADAHGKVDVDPHLTLIRKALLTASELEPNYLHSIALSEKPKFEVAQGLVTPAGQDSREFYNPTKIRADLFGHTEVDFSQRDEDEMEQAVIAGEAHVVGNVNRKMEDFISPQDLRIGLKNLKMDQFKKFVELLKGEEAHVGKYFSMADSKERMEDMRKKAEIDYMGEQKDPGRIEPIFIKYIRLLLDGYKRG